VFGKGYHIHDALNTLDRSLKYLKHILFETRVDRLVGEHLKEVKGGQVFLHYLLAFTCKKDLVRVRNGGSGKK